MISKNRVVALAETLDWRSPPEILKKALRQMAAGKGMERNEFEEALTIVLVPDCSTDLLETVVRLSLIVAVSAKARYGDDEWDAQINFSAGILLSERLDRDSLMLAAVHFEMTRQGRPRDDHRYAVALIREAVAHCKLCEVVDEMSLRMLGRRAVVEIRNAIKLCQEAYECLEDDDRLFAEAAMVEGAAHVQLSRYQRNPRVSLKAGLARFTQARICFDRIGNDPIDQGVVRMQEGVGRSTAAEAGLNSIVNHRRAVKLFHEARALFGEQHHISSQALGNIATALVRLAQLGENSIPNLRKAIAIFRETRQGLDPKSFDYRFARGRSETGEGIARLELAMCCDPIDNLRRAIRLHRKARRRFPRLSPDYSAALNHEMTARLRLIESGVQSEGDISELLKLGQKHTAETSAADPSWLPAVVLQIKARLAKTRLQANPMLAIAELQEILTFTRSCRTGMRSGDWGYAELGLVEADVLNAVRQEWVISSRSSSDAQVAEVIRGLIWRSIYLYGEIREGTSVKNPIYRLALGGEGQARLDLAPMTDQPAEHLAHAVELFATAAKLWPLGHLNWCAAGTNETKALLGLGNHRAAYKRMEEVLRAVERLRMQTSTEQDRIRFFEEHGWGYRAIVDICLRLGSSESIEEQDAWKWKAWHWVHRGTNRALLDLMRSVKPRLDSANRLLWADCEALAKKVDMGLREQARLQQRLLDQTASMEEMARLQLESGLRNAERRLVIQLDRYAAKWKEVIATVESARRLQAADVDGPDAVRRNLRELAGLTPEATPNSALETSRPLVIEFAVLNLEEVAIFVVPLWGEAAIHVERISVLHEQLFAWAGTAFQKAPPDDLEGRNTAGEEKRKMHVDGLGTALGEIGERFLLPLVERIENLNPSEVVLCPHGPLSLLPMHAIKCKDRTIIERWPVTYLPSPAFAGELTRLPKSTRSDALLLANPTGGLPGAEDEIRDVEKWLKRNAIESRCFSGSDATSARVLEAAPTASIFHFACHAQFDVEDFAKSGLVLADGRLTVRQLSAGVEMPKASLIFLSTCESARSNPGRIDELLALSRVFFCAGCPTVIASLWELEDVSASTFVDVFYKSWLNEKQTIAVAFREAALKTKELHPNPREWAALISVGAWR